MNVENCDKYVRVEGARGRCLGALSKLKGLDSRDLPMCKYDLEEKSDKAEECIINPRGQQSLYGRASKNLVISVG